MQGATEVMMCVFSTITALKKLLGCKLCYNHLMWFHISFIKGSNKDENAKDAIVLHYGEGGVGIF